MTQDSDCGEKFVKIEDGVTIARGHEEMGEAEITLYA